MRKEGILFLQVVWTLGSTCAQCLRPPTPGWLAQEAGGFGSGNAEGGR